MQEIKDLFIKIQQEIQSLQSRITITELNDKKKYMHINSSLMNIINILEELIKICERKTKNEEKVNEKGK